MRIALTLLVGLLASVPVLAATPLPAIPSRAACDTHLAKEGDVEARFGSMQTYLSCLLPGSAGTLVLEAQRLSSTSAQAFDRIDETSAPEVVVATVRNGRAMNNASRATLRYLANFLYQVEDEARRKAFCDLGELIFRKGELLDDLADLHVGLLETNFPEAAARMKESEATTRGYCQAKYDAYSEKRMSEPERNFVFPESYMSTVIACAEQEIDFYRLIDAEHYREAVIKDDAFGEAMDAIERINYHCHLHAPKDED